MICVSTGNIDFTNLISLMETEELVEIRLDLNDFSDNELVKIFSASTKTIATCRPGIFLEEERIRKLQLCIVSGASFVDIEIDSIENSFKTISATAKEHNCSLIISYHNYKRTPSLPELINLYRSSSEMGADIMKIATSTSNHSDIAKLLSLYNIKESSQLIPVIVIGMGEIGKITRVSALFLGAPFTYASFKAGEETAEGQIGKSDLQKIYNIIDDE